MIQLYSGTPGSGKSLHTAQKIYWYANSFKNHLIICNFEVDTSKLRHPERIVYIDNDALSVPDQVVEKAHDFNSENGLKENNIILIIDEAQLLFNAREWNIEGRKEWMSFFTQHRKLGFNIILIAQSKKPKNSVYESDLYSCLHMQSS